MNIWEYKLFKLNLYDYQLTQVKFVLQYKDCKDITILNLIKVPHICPQIFLFLFLFLFCYVLFCFFFVCFLFVCLFFFISFWNQLLTHFTSSQIYPVKKVLTLPVIAEFLLLAKHAKVYNNEPLVTRRIELRLQTMISFQLLSFILWN